MPSSRTDSRFRWASRRALAASIAVAVGSFALPALAKPQTRDGFHLRLAGGASWLAMQRSVETEGGGATPESTSSMGTSAEAFEILLGGSLAPGFVLGGGLIAAVANDRTLSRDGAPDAELVANLNVVMAGVLIDWYPSPATGLHCGGLAGLTEARSEVPGERTAFENVGGKGAGLALHIGYDLWVADEWSIGPELRLFGALLQDSDEQGALTLRQDAPLAGLGLSFSAAYH